MQARFDLFDSCSSCATVLPDVALCCPRYTAAADDAPFLFALPLLWLESALEFVIRHAPESLRLAAMSRQ